MGEKIGPACRFLRYRMDVDGVLVAPHSWHCAKGIDIYVEDIMGTVFDPSLDFCKGCQKGWTCFKPFIPL